MKYELKYKRFGASSILIEWPQNIDTSILYDILAFKSKIEQSFSSPIRFINHAYASLLLTFNSDIIDFVSETENLDAIYQQLTVKGNSTGKLWKIPVCYDERFGIDLHDLSIKKNIEIKDIIKRHTAPVYTVFFIGFLPGFLYLGGLDETLYIPRKATPRLKIEKGAVAIGGEQTGIYPTESPGGWQIIGNSPINFFDVSKATPCFAKAGDQIQFYPISLKQYSDIKTLCDAGVYVLESEVIYG